MLKVESARISCNSNLNQRNQIWLEYAFYLHKELNDRHVNKVNLRKEFFHISIDEIESIVLKKFPTSEFKRTILQNNINRAFLFPL